MALRMIIFIVMIMIMVVIAISIITIIIFFFIIIIIIIIINITIILSSCVLKHYWTSNTPPSSSTGILMHIESSSMRCEACLKFQDTQLISGNRRQLHFESSNMRFYACLPFGFTAAKIQWSPDALRKFEYAI